MVAPRLPLLAGAAALVAFLSFGACDAQSFTLGGIDHPTSALKGSEFAFDVSIEVLWDDTGAIQSGDEISYEVLDESDNVVAKDKLDVLADNVLLTSLDFTIEATSKGPKQTYVVVAESSRGSNNEQQTEFDVNVIAPGLTILPPLVTVAIAVITRNVIWALFGGVYFATFIMYGFRPFVTGQRVLDLFLVDSLSDVGHVFIILFSWFLSGMVAVMLRSGGGHGLAKALGDRFANTTRAAMGTVFFLGL